MKHGDPPAVTSGTWIMPDDPDLAMVYADMHTWALANEQEEDDPIEEGHDEDA